VKGGSQTVLAGKLTAPLKVGDNLLAAGQVSDLVSELWVRFNRKDLAIEAETPDVVAVAIVQGRQECSGVV
jgi:pheromone shutdown protein TraB